MQTDQLNKTDRVMETLTVTELLERCQEKKKRPLSTGQSGEDVTPRTGAPASRATSTMSSSHDRATTPSFQRRLIEYLFQRFAAIYPPGRFKTLFQDGTPQQVLASIEAVKAEWLDSEVGALDRETVDLALKFVRRRYPWPPTIAEFLAICESPETLGLPGADEAYLLVAEGQHSLRSLHPVIRGAAEATGVFELRHMPEHRTRPIFKRNYEITMRRFREGKQVCKPIPKALPEPPKPTITPKEVSEAKREFQRLKEALRASVS